MGHVAAAVIVVVLFGAGAGIALLAWWFHRRITTVEFDRERDRLDQVLQRPARRPDAIDSPPAHRRLRSVTNTVRDTGEHMIIAAVGATGIFLRRLRAWIGSHSREITVVAGVAVVAGGLLLALSWIVPDRDDQADGRRGTHTPMIVTATPPAPSQTASRRTSEPVSAIKPADTAAPTLGVPSWPPISPSPAPAVTPVPTPTPSTPVPVPTDTGLPIPDPTPVPTPTPSTPIPVPTDTPDPSPSSTIVRCPDRPEDDAPTIPPCGPR